MPFPAHLWYDTTTENEFDIFSIKWNFCGLLSAGVGGAILKSLTTPYLPGSIGSDQPLHTAPYFGVPIHVLDPARGVTGYFPAGLITGNAQYVGVDHGGSGLIWIDWVLW